ncbi:peptide/nickel transport system substrate-binding protein [Arthrobacter alpinus]|uniref:Peptide/nickel transport system substrate-binding protein n=1 Tax=Arthrobacter alpinus TaxID=656366 RepID=A0A1H5E2M9_9MICC|nr:ABC transporter substrate-binding protein [Arthrobacter alpinus]SED85378.1 peptide/nickel transport system substrate-binding protein [Arthrobacter alpinus]
MAKNMFGFKSVIALAGVSVLAMTACTGPAGDGGTESGGATGAPVVVGTTDKTTFLDPAGSYDNGSFMVMNQIYPFVLNSAPGSADPKPDIAESAEFTSPTEYTVKLKAGLKWANGTELDSKDVKFSFDRQLKINDPKGPASLLGNLASVEAPDATTVVFKLKVGNDQTFLQVLTSPAGPIVDDSVFSADAVTTDEDIVAGKSFAGQFTIDSFKKNELISFKKYPDYKGLLGAPKSDSVTIKYYADSNNLKLDVQKGNIDVAWRSLTATDIDSLKSDKNVKVDVGPGGEIRYIVFNFDTMPFGTKTENADAAKSLAVRQAMANSIDRAKIADQVYKGTYLPLYSPVPAGFTGAIEPLKAEYGDGNGAPDVAKATKALADAGVETPVTLDLQYNPDHYGSSSGDEYAAIKAQLEATKLFKVNLQSTEWVSYSDQRVKDVYPMYQLGWFPDYSDADNYLTPFFSKNNFLSNHYDNPDVQKMITDQVTTTDAAARTKLLEEIQTAEAKDLSTLPLLQGAQVAVSSVSVKGTADTLDASFKFRLGVLSK